MEMRVFCCARHVLQLSGDSQQQTEQTKLLTKGFHNMKKLSKKIKYRNIYEKTHVMIKMQRVNSRYERMTAWKPVAYGSVDCHKNDQNMNRKE